MLVFAVAAMILAAPQQTAPGAPAAQVRGSMAPAVGYLSNGQSTVAGAMGMTPAPRSNQPPASPDGAQTVGDEMSSSSADDFDMVDNLGRNDMSPEETDRIADARAAASDRIDSLGRENRRGAGANGLAPASPRRPPN